ncbi:MAG: phosphatase PAP2 family protein [Caldilineaceae bacterium]
MRSWFWSTVWRLHHYDVALSYRIVFKPEEKKAKLLGYWLALLGAHLGDSWLWVLIAGWLWRQAHRRQQSQRRSLILTWVISVIATTGVTLLVKRQVRRQRPGRGHLLYGAGPDVHSFPSGHAARLSAIAIWSNLLLPYGGWLAWPLLLFVSWCRVAIGIHYAGDVVAGTVVGSTIGLLFQRLWQQKPEARSQKTDL